MAKRTRTGKAKAAAKRHPTMPSRRVVQDSTVGKRVVFDRETWQAIDLLARDSMKSFQELVDEAFRDLLDKHGRPDTLREALRDSLTASGTETAENRGRVRRRRPR